MLQLPKKRSYCEKLPGTSKKLVLVSATSIPVTDSGEKVVRVLCIHYSVGFQENQEQIRALLNNGSKVNAMSLAYVEKLGFKTRKTNVRAQKIDGSALKIFKMVIADF